MPIVVIDPGHGGRDSGAVGNKTYEKNNNLTLGLGVGKILSQHGVTVYYTRTDDRDFCFNGYDENTDLQNRIAVAKQYNPDVFVSCHNNSFNHQANGIETHCFKLGGTDEQLARSIQDSMASSLQFFDRGIKITNLYVTRKFDGTNTSACLVEYGFIDSEEDLILANMNKAIIAVAKGILSFLGIQYDGEIQGDENLHMNRVVLLNTPEPKDMILVKEYFDYTSVCPIFFRVNGQPPEEVFKADQLIILGGADVPNHQNREYYSGSSWFGTVGKVAQSLGQ